MGNYTLLEIQLHFCILVKGNSFILWNRKGTSLPKVCKNIDISCMKCTLEYLLNSRVQIELPIVIFVALIYICIYISQLNIYIHLNNSATWEENLIQVTNVNFRLFHIPEKHHNWAKWQWHGDKKRQLGHFLIVRREPCNIKCSFFVPLVGAVPKCFKHFPRPHLTPFQKRCIKKQLSF